MSQDLLHATINLTTQCSLLQFTNALRNSPSIKPITSTSSSPSYDSSNVTNEVQQVQIYEKILKQIDHALMNAPEPIRRYSSSHKPRQPYKEEDFIKLKNVLRQYTMTGSDNDDVMQTLIGHLKTLLTVNKHQVEKLTMMTGPITRSLYHVQGLPCKEDRIRTLVKRRDELILEYVGRIEAVTEKDKTKLGLRKENEMLVEDIRRIIRGKEDQKDDDDDEGGGEEERQNETITNLKARLQNLEDLCHDIESKIQRLVVVNGLNWAGGVDQRLAEIVLRAGEGDL